MIEVARDEAVPYAVRVDAAKKELRSRLDRAGLIRIGDELERLMAPSIRIRTAMTSEENIDRGCSKMGGRPDLPEEIDWPECKGVALAFLCQLRLADVAGYDVAGWLPREGMLYFFYEAKSQPWGFDPKHRGHWIVICHRGDAPDLRLALMPGNLPWESRFEACQLGFSGEITLPSLESPSIMAMKLSSQEKDAYLAFELDCPEGEPVHRLLGHPDAIQNDMQLECQFVSNGLYMGERRRRNTPKMASLKAGASEWQLLLQFDSDEKCLRTMWGDTGRVYFWIREEDLRKRDFEKTWLILQCY